MKAVIVDPTRTLPDERQRRALGPVNGSVVPVDTADGRRRRVTGDGIDESV